MLSQIPTDLLYVLLIFGMFIVSRYLQRFRLPSAISCVAIGLGVGMLGGGLPDMGIVRVLAVIGIVTLFLFAGMEIDFVELHRASRQLILLLCIQSLVTIIAVVILKLAMGLEIRSAMLVALALFTPSTGFILDSLATLDVNQEERFWIKSMAIATELVALVTLFFVAQSSSWVVLSVSSLALVALVFLLPLVFRFFTKKILPYAPKTEFAFLVIVALLCAMFTKKLGVYYLVGAFIVGVTEQRLRQKIPALNSPQLINGVELFAGFFIPFYFLNAGLNLHAENFSFSAILLGVIFLLTALPIRLLGITLGLRIFLKEPIKRGLRVSAAVLPTLVFSMVLAEILRDRFAGNPALVGGLIIYALGNTLIPGFVLRLPVPEYNSPELPLHMPRTEE